MFLKYFKNIVIYQKIGIQTQIYAMQLRAMPKLKAIYAEILSGKPRVISSTGYVVKMNNTLYIYAGEESKGGLLSTSNSPMAKLTKTTVWKFNDSSVKGSVEFRKTLKFWRDLLVNIE